MPGLKFSRIAAISLLSVVTLFAAGCGGDGDAKSNVSDQVIDDRERQWDDQNIEDYTLAYEERRSGPDLRVTVEVRDSRIDDIDYDTDDLRPGGLTGGPFTVDGLFDLIRRAKNEARELNVQFDETRGYPIFIAIDWVRGNVNDEVDIEVTSFTAR